MMIACEDIVIEILARLPVKSLIRFMAVCQFWKSTIESHYFKSRFSNRPKKLLVHTDQECYALDENLVVSQIADFPFKHWCRRVKVVGTDNGLVCIAICDANKEEYPRVLIIWNPCIRKHAVIPTNPMDEPDRIYADGFGSSISGDDYKYVRMVSVSGFFSSRDAFDIFSWKTGTWRRVFLDKNSTYWEYIFSACAASLLKGRLHWMSFHPFYSRKNCIHYFDLEDEAFEVIMLPRCFRSVFRGIVFVIKESLAVIAIEERSIMYSSVWVMEEYGNVNSWSKLYRVDFASMINVDYAFQHSWMREDSRRIINSVVHSFENGELLIGLEALDGRDIVHPRKLVKYNPETRKATDIGGVLSHVLRGFSNYYKESLVFLTTDDHRVLADHEVLSGARPSTRHGRRGVSSEAGPSTRRVRRRLH